MADPPVGRRYLGRDIGRLAAFRRGVEDVTIVRRARAELDGPDG